MPGKWVLHLKCRGCGHHQVEVHEQPDTEPSFDSAEVVEQLRCAACRGKGTYGVVQLKYIHAPVLAKVMDARSTEAHHVRFGGIRS